MRRGHCYYWIQEGVLYLLAILLSPLMELELRELDRLNKRLMGTMASKE